jgi:hypothetical protein
VTTLSADAILRRADGRLSSGFEGVNGWSDWKITALETGSFSLLRSVAEKWPDEFPVLVVRLPSASIIVNAIQVGSLSG